MEKEMGNADYKLLLEDWDNPVDNPEDALDKLKAMTEVPEELPTEEWDAPVDNPEAALEKLKKMMNAG